MARWIRILFIACACAVLSSARPTAAAPAPATPATAAATDIRSPQDVRKAAVELLTEARDAVEKLKAKEVTVLASRAPSGGAARVGRFLQEELRAAFYEGPEIAKPPDAVKAPPAVLNPASIARLKWGKAGVPTAVLAVVAKGRPGGGVEVTLTLLDGTAQHWHGAIKLSKPEIAALPLVPALNEHVLKFAVERRGEQVGNGECWTLAADAITAAGGERPRGYVHGRELRPGETVLPGDVMQFNSVRLQNRKGWRTMGHPDHTAVIQSASGSKTYSILHQNTGGGEDGKKVQSLTINLAEMTSGTIKIYRPQRKDAAAKATARRASAT